MFGRRAAGCSLSRTSILCRSVAARGAYVLVIALSVATAPSHAAPASDHDYLTPELRARVESLKAGVQRTPTNADSRVQRARILWEWVNAYALTGKDIPVDATRVAQTTLTYPTAVANDASIAAMVREFTVLDEQPGAIGTLEADTGPFEANAFATFTQTYTVGANAIETGGGLLIARHFGVDLNGELQAKDPAAPNYVTIAASNPNVSFTNAMHGVTGMHGGFRQSRDTLVFRLAAGRLAQGEALTITYGDTSGGSPGVKMPSLSSDKIPFPIYLDFDGSDDFFTLPIQPIRVTGTRVAGVHAFAPSIVEPGEPFDLAVRAEDQFANRARPPIPSWNVYINGELHTAIPAGGPPIVVLEDLTVDAPGVVRFTIESGDGAIAGQANPILVVQDPPHRIFWGDTHGHSGFAEGIGTPDRFMTWARDDARLDYVVHSEHDIWMDDFEWQTLRDNVRSYSRAGEFLAFLGYEWTVRNFQGGHHNVIFRNPAQRERIISPFYPTLSDLYLGLRRYHDPKDVVVIPHAHQAGDYRLSDPLLEPLVEVLSMHGTFEQRVAQPIVGRR